MRKNPAFPTISFLTNFSHELERLPLVRAMMSLEDHAERSEEELDKMRAVAIRWQQRALTRAMYSWEIFVDCQARRAEAPILIISSGMFWRRNPGQRFSG